VSQIAIVWKSREMRSIQASGNAYAEHQGTIAFSGQVHRNIGAIRIAALSSDSINILRQRGFAKVRAGLQIRRVPWSTHSSDLLRGRWRICQAPREIDQNYFLPRCNGQLREDSTTAASADIHRLDAASLRRLALEKGSAGARYHAVADEGVPLGDIADVIGRRLNVPVVSKYPEEAANHFGVFAGSVSMDGPSSNKLIQEHLVGIPLTSNEGAISQPEQTPQPNHLIVQQVLSYSQAT
jgi:hypothetical protein